MSTHLPRPPYTQRELQELYPPSLSLEQVHIFFRHGERTPSRPRFTSTGLPRYWPFCSGGQGSLLFASALDTEAGHGAVRWARVLQSFARDVDPTYKVDQGDGDSPSLVSDPEGGRNALPLGPFLTMCGHTQLTDRGRLTAQALGSRLRQLYVRDLGFAPTVMTPRLVDQNAVVFQSTAVPRAIESLMNVVSGFWPSERWGNGVGEKGAKLILPIIIREAERETLYPNTGRCPRLYELFKAFTAAAKTKWHGGPELALADGIIGNHTGGLDGRGNQIPPGVRIDGIPRVTGILDTINAVRAHDWKYQSQASKKVTGEMGYAVPGAWREKKGWDIFYGSEFASLERQWSVSLPKEFYDPKLLNILSRAALDEWFGGMQDSAEYRSLAMGPKMGDLVSQMVAKSQRWHADPLKMSLIGCHDTSIAAMLTSIGAMNLDSGDWPSFTCHVAVELFRKDGEARRAEQPVSPIGRKKLKLLGPDAINDMKGWYVRIRYNDEMVTIPGCRAKGKHLADVKGGEGFCTLVAFKEIVDKFTPDNWSEACLQNLEKPAIPREAEPAGY